MSLAARAPMIVCAALMMACSFDGGGVPIGGDGSAPGDGPSVITDALGGDAIGPDAPVPLSPLQLDDVRLVYGELGVFQVFSQHWSSSTRSWEAATPSGFLDGQYLWMVNGVSPEGAAVELVAALAASNTTTNVLRLLRWTEDRWQLDWTASSPIIDVRTFDLAFERSGDALVVYSDGFGVPKYRVRRGGAWQTERSVPLPANTDCAMGCAVEWVELVPNPDTDDVALAWSDSNANLSVAVWNGEAWRAGSTHMLEVELERNRLSNRVHNRSFDLAWERQTGELLAVWGRNNSNDVWYSSYFPATEQWLPAASRRVVNGAAHHVDLASDPSSDRIAAGIFDLGDGTERLGLLTWSGDDWVDVVELDSQIRQFNDTAQADWPGAVGWLGSTGVAVCVYPDEATGALEWARWQSSGGWQLQTPVAIPAKSYSESLQLVEAGGNIVVAVGDFVGGLFAASYDGTDWTVAPMQISSSLSSTGSAPFSLATRVR